MTTATKTLELTVTKGDALPDAVEQLSGKPGTHVLRLALALGTLKAQTDRIRRIPRQRGLNALTVTLVETTKAHHVLSVTNTGTKAAPWPTPDAQPVKAKPASKAKATKAPAKRKASGK